MKRIFAISLLCMTFVTHALKDTVNQDIDAKFLWITTVAKEAFSNKENEAVCDALKNEKTNRQIEYNEFVRNYGCSETGIAGACSFAEYDGIVGLPERRKEAILAGAERARKKLEDAGYLLGWNKNTLLYSVVEVAKQAEDEGLFERIEKSESLFEEAGEYDSEWREQALDNLANQVEEVFKKRYAAMTYVAYVGLEKVQAQMVAKRNS